MTPDDAHIPVNPALTTSLQDTPEHQPAEQGPMPDALPPAPPVPRPSGEGLGEREVNALLGSGDASATEANIALERAEGLDPITES